MSDINDTVTYACDRCSCPTQLTALVPFKDEHICRICDAWYHETPLCWQCLAPAEWRVIGRGDVASCDRHLHEHMQTENPLTCFLQRITQSPK